MPLRDNPGQCPVSGIHNVQALISVEPISTRLRLLDTLPDRPRCNDTNIAVLSQRLETMKVINAATRLVHRRKDAREDKNVHLNSPIELVVPPPLRCLAQAGDESVRCTLIMFSLPKNAQLWLPGLLSSRLRRALRPGAGGFPTHIFFCIADHYEPAHGGADANVQRSRVAAWLAGYPRMARSSLTVTAVILNTRSSFQRKIMRRGF